MASIFFAYQQIVQVLLLTLSTVYYPEVVKAFPPDSLTVIVTANPLILAAEAMRQYPFAGAPIQPMLLLSILITSIPLTIIGAVAYLTALRTVRIKGKL